MKNHVVENYENYREENRLTTNNARRIEFLTTTRIMDELLPGNSRVLDCAAGTGIYSFYLADKGHNVTATDITPRHVEIMNHIQKEKTYKMNTAVLDATDMNIFEDETFDVVLNMGPFYHLTSKEQRTMCMSESLRVLKKGGTFAIHDLMSPGRYGDMQAFVQKLRDMGYERVELIDTTDGSFMTPKEAKRLMLRGSTLLAGRK